MVDAATLARELGVTRGFVYEHAEELKALRLGHGPKPRLRFDLDAARAAYRGEPTPTVAPPAPRAGSHRSTSRARLLPIGGRRG